MRSHFLSAKKSFLFPLVLFASGTLFFAQTPFDVEFSADADEEPVIEITEEIDEGISEEIPIETDEEIAEEIAEEIGEEIAEENDEEIGEEIPVETEEEIAEENGEEIPVETEETDDVELDIDTSEEEPHKYEALAMIRYKNTDAVSFRLKASVAPGPYILGTSIAAGYTAFKLIQPFYFGGFIEPHLGFPQKDFPYKYQLNGSEISSPLIVGGKVYFPFGICVYPFQKNIEFFVDIAPGIVMNFLWNTKFGEEAITSRIFTGFYAALRTGITYKNFSVFLEGNYDAVTGFGVSLGVGYSIPISYTTQIEEEAPKSLED